MPDFSALYRKPAGTAKRPPTLPGGKYLGIIKQYEMSESREKHTPCVRYFITLLDWPSNAPEEWVEVDEDGKRHEYVRSDINLGTRQQRFEFWFPLDEATGEPTDNSMWRFDQFLRTLDLEIDGIGYEQLFPMAVGHKVWVDIQQELNQSTNRIYTNVNRIAGAPTA